jgi:uncharacterized protein YlxP (DUF503 family)
MTTTPLDVPLTHDESATLLGQTMGLVAVTAGFFAVGAYLGRDMSYQWGWLWFIAAFVCLIEVQLHLNDSHDLKGKRKTLHSLKAQLRKRFGASVAEVDGHDTWQRSTLVCALVGGGDVSRRGDELERFVEARCPDGCNFERDLLSLADIRG